jgi:alpha-L-arabinofuranosidase
LTTPALLAAVAAQSTSAAREPSPSAGGILQVSVDQPSHRISPNLYGIFFEEINCAGDGGLYAELVRNGSFEDADGPQFWKTEGAGAVKVSPREPASGFDTHCMEIDASSGQTSVKNGGYWGISTVKGASYRLKMQMRSAVATGGLRVEIVGSDGKVLAHADTPVPKADWTEFSAKLWPDGTDPKAALRITAPAGSMVQIDDVSLMPSKTWKRRENGLRPDLAELLNGLKPSFVRFPGGCWVEGDTMETAMRWKQTIGPVFERRTLPNLWGYISTNGLGFHEYLQMCEDLHAEPLFVINCGMALRQVVPIAKMDEFVQDALDAIEYANGPKTSRWGAVRAKNGHPRPFNLKYMEIGNENGGSAYAERYAMFARAIKAKYPDMHLIADSWGGIPADTPVEIMDEHYYNSPQFFISNADRYDAYDRKGPKVYVGEYAVTQGCGQGNLIAALGEAAFMAGMERNSDVVAMASYAPLFANVHIKGWNPDLICFDSSRSYGIPSYYVQQLFSQNRGDRVLPTTVSEAKVEAPRFPGGGIGLGTWDTHAEFKDLKVTHGDQVLLDSPDCSALTPKVGSWAKGDGTLKETDFVEGARAVAGDRSWQEYKLTVKARKLEGSEGFLVLFGMKDNSNFLWWNLGGWGNTRDTVEETVVGGKSAMGRGVRERIEAGRWYDLEVDYSKDRILCLLDGKVVHTATPHRSKALYVTSSLVERTGEVILKVVNVSNSRQNWTVQLDGAAKGRVEGFESVLTGKPADENDLAHPRRVAPTTREVSFAGPTFRHEFPAYSVTIMRVKTGL